MLSGTSDTRAFQIIRGVKSNDSFSENSVSLIEVWPVLRMSRMTWLKPSKLRMIAPIGSWFFASATPLSASRSSRARPIREL